MRLSAKRLLAILGISLPVMGGMLSQNLLNLCDTAMVGRLGPVDLAAVGIGGVANFLAMSAMLGMSPAVQAMAARRKGEGAEGVMAEPLNGGLFLSVLFGIPVSVLLYHLAPLAFSFLSHDADVVATGTPYLQARIIAVTAIGINFSFRGYWNGVSRAKCYMISLSSMNVINMVLNYMLIFGHWGAPEMGSVGAGVASCIATFAGSAIYCYFGFRFARPNGFLQRWPSAEVLRMLLRLAFPSALQQMFYAGGVTVLFWIIGRVGTVELAAANIIVTLYLLGVMPGLGFGMAAASLIGQALGAGKPEEAERCGVEVVLVAVLVLGLIALPMLVVPQFMLRLFTPSPEVIAAGKGAIILAGIGLPIQAVGLVLMQALMGAGDNVRVMLISIGCQWCILLPGAYLVGPVCGMGLTAIWVIQLLYRVLLSVSMVARWRQGIWRTIEV
jgi:MATE family multidrug resistance protein